MAKPKSLTRKQKRFVDLLLADPKMGQRDAAIGAGFAAKNADAIASRLVKKSQVKAAIAEAIAQRSARTAISQDETLKRIDALSKANLKNVASWDEGGSNLKIRSSSDLSEEEAYQIEAFEVQALVSGVVKTKIKMRKPDSALEMLGRHQGLFDIGDQGKPAQELEEAIKQLDQEEGKDI